MIHTRIASNALKTQVLYLNNLKNKNIEAYELGMINVEAECELASARQVIQKMIQGKSNLPYEPTRDWRFLDCKFARICNRNQLNRCN